MRPKAVKSAVRSTALQWRTTPPAASAFLDATELHLALGSAAMGQFAKKAEAALRGNRRPITPARRALLKLLEEEERPLAPRELPSERRRRGGRGDRVSVYRNVATLLELGLLHRIVGSAAVRPCPGPAAEAKQARCHHAIV